MSVKIILMTTWCCCWGFFSSGAYFLFTKRTLKRPEYQQKDQKGQNIRTKFHTRPFDWCKPDRDVSKRWADRPPEGVDAIAPVVWSRLALASENVANCDVWRLPAVTATPQKNALETDLQRW